VASASRAASAGFSTVGCERLLRRFFLARDARDDGHHDLACVGAAPIRASRRLPDVNIRKVVLGGHEEIERGAARRAFRRVMHDCPLPFN